MGLLAQIGCGVAQIGFGVAQIGFGIILIQIKVQHRSDRGVV